MDTYILSSRQGTPQSSGQPHRFTQNHASRLGRVFIILVLLLSMIGGTASNDGRGQHTALASPLATQTDLVGPPGSGDFGTTVTVLTNGNLVITDPKYSSGGLDWIGAVYLYDGETGERISMLTGSSLYDQVSSGGVKALSNGNFVIYSPLWDYNATQVEAVTWCSGTAGCSGVVSPANSLVGPGFDWSNIREVVIPLTNGNYVVNCTFCDVGGVVDVGAVTWADGTTGIAGSPTAANSLVGSTAGDAIGYYGVTPLPGGNYVVGSPNWDNGTASSAGAATWCDGDSGCMGPVTSTNSLVGSSANDSIGTTVKVLPDGNYYVWSMSWDNGGAIDAGSFTWCQGDSGCLGPVSAANSLVGENTGDNIGYFGIVVLANGNIVVPSWNWEYYMIGDRAGAVTLCSGTSGCAGVVSPANSLVGSWQDDEVGKGGVVPLVNGNYVVLSPGWDRLHEPGHFYNHGAVTWCSGETGCTGPVSEANSLVGNWIYDAVGSGATALANGNYVVRSTNWYNAGIERAGAVTWCPGTASCVGIVSPDNSLVGEHLYDYVGDGGITPLANGNYVVLSPVWDNGVVQDAGAVTWGDGDAPITGYVSAANSLVGSSSSDAIGKWISEVGSGHYVVSSPFWDNGSFSDAGAATWCDGSAGCTGVITAANSLVGSQENDRIAGNAVARLTNGDYVVSSAEWNNGAVADVGAITWVDGDTGLVGYVTPDNSLIGSSSNDWLGSGSVMALPSGNYVVRSPYWDNGSVVNAGAITWAEASGMVGVVSAANSRVGSAAEDLLGAGGFSVLADGRFIYSSPNWDNGGIQDAGAVTLNSEAALESGPLTPVDSVLGAYYYGGQTIFYLYNTTYDYMVVSRPEENIVTIFPALPHSPTLYVDGALGVDNSDCSYPSSPCQTIGYALGRSVAGDTLLVKAGSYLENLVISWPVTIVGGYAAGDATWSVQSGETVIDGQQLDTVITLEGGSSGTVLASLTIANGYGVMVGGVDALNASLIILNCTIRDNVGYDSESSIGGGGVAGAVSTNTLSILNSRILRNEINEGASGVRAHSGSLTMVNTLVANNSGDFAIHVNGATDFMNVTVANNSDGILFNAGEVQHEVKNSIVWSNTNSGVFNGGAGTVTISYSDIQGGFAGTGNLNVDPLFVNPAEEDYHLQPGSPCINAGDVADAPASDLDGKLRDTLPDMGAYEWTNLRFLLSMIRKAVSP